MNKFFMICGWLVMMVATGCIPSLHPLVSEKDAVWEEKIVGAWMPEGNDAVTLTFSRKEPSSPVYLAEHIDDNGKKGRFDVRATQIEGQLFLDFYPLKPDPELNGFYAIHLVPAHTFMRVTFLENGTLHLHMLDHRWLDEQLKTTPTALAHERRDDGDGLVLTASTAALRTFIGTHVADVDAWGDGSRLHRPPVVKPAPEPVPAAAAAVPAVK